MMDITISKVSNGFILNVGQGYKLSVYETKENLLEGVNQYLTDAELGAAPSNPYWSINPPLPSSTAYDTAGISAPSLTYLKKKYKQHQGVDPMSITGTHNG